MQRFGAHRPVTVAVALINLAWLLPLAALVAFDSLHDVVCAPIRDAPLTAVALWFGAGNPERSSAQLGAPNV